VVNEQEYEVSGMVTIGVTKTVRAKSRAAALKAAKQLILPDVRSCSPNDDAFWDVDELDGEVQDIEVDE